MIRAALPGVLALMLCLLAGCAAQGTREAKDPAVVHVGSAAAEIDRGHAYAYSQDMAALIEARIRMQERRSQMLLDEAEYRRKAAEVNQDPALSKTDQKLYADQYLSLALDRQQQAKRFHDLINSYSDQIARFDSLRRDRLRRSEAFDDIVVPKP